MVDLELLETLKLSDKPRGQRAVATFGLVPNYHITNKVEIILEGLENFPKDQSVIIAMNHTDRYNYWPLQFKLSRLYKRFTATWVKAKYYEHPIMRLFMMWTNNIPTVSRGYLIAKDFMGVTGRRPSQAQYETLRILLDQPEHAVDTQAIPETIFAQPRHVLGMDFNPDEMTWAHFMSALFRAFMVRFVALNRQALDVGADLIIFPQGTRSIRLSKGHTGLAEIALALRATIVPVGCSGSDLCYPGGSPWARSGRIVYRFGTPMTYESMAAHHIHEPFTPFTPEAEAAHQDRFQALVDEVMDRINELLDPRYRYTDDRTSDGVTGTQRFI